MMCMSIEKINQTSDYISNKNVSVNKKLISCICFIALCILAPCYSRAQFRYSHFKNKEDSLVLIEKHLERWHPYGGLHLTSDAELYYGGPSFQAGVDYNIKRNLSIGSYIHYFYGSVASVRNNGISEEGRFRTFTVATILQLYAGKGWYKGFFFGAGLAIQDYADRFRGIFGYYDENHTTLMGAFRLGYTFPAGLRAISFEFNATGPYSTSYEPNEVYMEIFTQVSLGVRFIF